MHDTSTSSQVQQIGQMLLNAYEQTTTAPGASIDVSQTVQSGTDPIAEAKGSYTVWFKARTGQTSLTLQGPNGSTTLVAIRAGSAFYSAKTQDKLSGNRMDLAAVGRGDPTKLPQIQAPGVDPFQLTTLLGAVQWPDTVKSLGPVVVDDSTGRHTEYQITIDTARLATHQDATDRAWLQAMASEPRGDLVTLETTVQNGRIDKITASLPIPAAPIPKIQPGKRSAPATPAYQTPPPASVVITEQFDYSAQPAPVHQP
ncbi:MAG: hypothetical protein ACRDRL_08265 [Sciscionella sp.]